MNPKLCFALACFILLIVRNVTAFEKTSHKNITLGDRTFFFYQEQVPYPYAVVQCALNGMKLAVIKNRNFALLMQEYIPKSAWSKSVGRRE